MVKKNFKSLIIAIILGCDSWVWSLFITGSAFVDFTTFEQYKSPNLTLYIILLIVNIVISLFFLTIYVWKYEKDTPIIPERWELDAIILGSIICFMKFLLDSIFFGIIIGMNLILYFWIQSAAGYVYIAIIFEILIIAYLIYGRRTDKIN